MLSIDHFPPGMIEMMAQRHSLQTQASQRRQACDGERQRRSERSICERVSCVKCGHFLGFIMTDGTGPIFDECASDSAEHRLACPMYSRLEPYQPKRVPLGLAGGRGGPKDEDAGGYGSIARRRLEDGGI